MLKNFFSEKFSLLAILFALLLFIPNLTKAQSTVTQSGNQLKDNLFVWTVSDGDFDSTDAIWSTSFYLTPHYIHNSTSVTSDFTDSTQTSTITSSFKGSGSIVLGTTSTTGGTYDGDFVLYGTWDESDWILVDTLSIGVSSTTAVTFTVDMSAVSGRIPYEYKIKATNNGGDNSFIAAIKFD